MYITWQTIITAGSVIVAVLAIFGIVLKVHKWYLQQEKQNTEIARMKEENRLICEALSAVIKNICFS